MIIDCHGHYTTAPEPHQLFREAQLAAHKDGSELPIVPHISDDQIIESIEQNQLRLLKERDADMTSFSPRASGMAHHL
ncbi:MAG: amidohydrolase, partial [Pseudomonadales bacterium]